MSTATTFNDLSAVISDIKSRVSLSDIVNEVTEVKRPTDHMHKALCPFHQERTPSFTITPDKGLYHCFGCHASGDLITFYKDYYKLSTVEAIEEIASKNNISIEQHKRPLTPEEIEERRLIDINTRLANYLHEQAEEIEEFWQARGIDPYHEDLASFKLGYCDSPTDLKTILSKIGAKPSDADILDLNRAQMWTRAIVYPYINSRGEVRGFKNRPLYDDATGQVRPEGTPKFIGTVNTPIHEVDLYGLHQARRNITDYLGIVEGQHDALSMVQAGIKNIVSSDGTSLNIEKLTVLQEMGIKRVVIIFDGDRAGKEASKSIAKMLNEHRDTLNMVVKIASIQDGSDPDQMIREGQRIPLIMAVESAVYANQHLVDMIIEDMLNEGKDVTSVTGKLDFINEIKPILLLSKGLEQSFLVEYVAQKIKSRPEFLEDLLRSEETAGKKSVLFDPDGEKMVLAQMIRDEDFRHEALTEMKSSYFYVIKHQHLFDIISQIVRDDIPVNATTIRTAINNKGFNDIFADGFVEKLEAMAGNYRATMEDLIDKAVRRQVQREAQILANTAGDLSTSTPLLIETHLQGIQSVADKQSDGGTILKPEDGAVRFMNRIHENMRNPNTILGLPIRTQPTLTRLLRGLQGNRLITIAANQSVGKTTLLANIINDVSIEDGVPWLHFTVEMSADEIADKIIGINAEVNGDAMKDGTMSNEEYGRVQNASLKYYNSKLYIDDEANTLEQIINTTRRYIRNHNIAGISIDYIQLLTMEKSKARQRYDELGDISGALKRDVAKKMNIPVIILSQLNRGAVSADVATAEDGAGAYKIAQDSDAYLTIKDKSDDTIEEQGGIQIAGNQTLFLDKNRQGRADVFIDMLFMRDTQKMVEIAK